MLNKIKNIFTDPFWKNVATLFTGTAIAQALPILLLPVITRLYPKGALGFYFVYAGIGLLSQIIVSFQYQLSIVLPKKKKDADNLLIINFIIIISVSVIMFLGIFLFFDIIAGFIKQKELLQWLYMIPVSAFFLGSFNALSYYFNREKKYKTISAGKVLKTLFYSTVHIVLGVWDFKNSGLIIGLIIGQFISTGFLFYKLIFNTDFCFKFNYSELKILLIRYKDIPVFNTIISFLNMLSNQLPLFLLTRYFNASAAADYGLANRIVTTPMGLIGQSVGQVFYQEASAIKNNNISLENIVKTTYKRLFKIGFIPFILLAAFAPFIFKIVFNTDYESSGQITRILIPWLFLMFLNSPLSFIITILNKQKVMVFYDIILLICRFVALYSGYYLFNNIFASVALYSLAGFVLNGMLIFYFIFISKQPIKEIYGND
jgi:O-antigen/teichoic acid export membrane protein